MRKIVTFIIIFLEFLLLVESFVEKFLFGLGLNHQIFTFPIIEIIIKGPILVVLIFMVHIFIKIVNFFRHKKEEKMSKFQRHRVSCRHGTLVFLCKFLAVLTLVD
jgi:hypothetical protein